MTTDMVAIKQRLCKIGFLNREKYRDARKKDATLPSIDSLEREFGSFTKFRDAFSLHPDVKTKKIAISVKAKKNLVVEPEGHTELERRFLLEVDLYKTRMHKSWPTLVELFRIARGVLGLEDEHKVVKTRDRSKNAMREEQEAKISENLDDIFDETVI